MRSGNGALMCQRHNPSHFVQACVATVFCDVLKLLDSIGGDSIGTAFRRTRTLQEDERLFNILSCVTYLLCLANSRNLSSEKKTYWCVRRRDDRLGQSTLYPKSRNHQHEGQFMLRGSGPEQDLTVSPAFAFGRTPTPRFGEPHLRRAPALLTSICNNTSTATCLLEDDPIPWARHFDNEPSLRDRG